MYLSLQSIVTNSKQNKPLIQYLMKSFMLILIVMQKVYFMMNFWHFLVSILDTLLDKF